MQLLKQETDRLLSLAASAEAELASGDTVALPEEAAGKLRSAAGKARLLASQKMQQFEGLCQKNIVGLRILYNVQISFCKIIIDPILLIIFISILIFYIFVKTFVLYV